MRRLLLFIALAASATATSLAADNTTLSGKWKIHANVQGNESDVTCDFIQKDKVLSGTCATDKGEKPLTGKVDGKTFLWSYESEYEGTPLTVKYSGTLDTTATKLTGTLTVDPFGADGDFAGAPTK